MQRFARLVGRPAFLRRCATATTTAAAPAPAVDATAAAPAAPKANGDPTLRLDLASLDPQRLMVVTANYLDDKRKSRGAAQRLVDAVVAHVENLPVVFLATVSSAEWPAGIMTDAVRVTLRQRITKGVLDLSGDNVARVFIAWARTEVQRRDTVLFKRLGKLIVHHVNDIRDAQLMLDLIRSIGDAGLKPPASFAGLLCRRVVALDRRDVFTVKQAQRALRDLARIGEVDGPTKVAMLNRIITTLRKDVEKASGIATSDDDPTDVLRDDIEPRDTRWPLGGSPMAHVELKFDDAAAITERHALTRKRMFALFSALQEQRLTSPLYTRPLNALLVPVVRTSHPLDVLGFVRGGGMRRIVDSDLANAVFDRVNKLNVPFGTQVELLGAVANFHRHLARTKDSADAPTSERTPIVSLQLVNAVIERLANIDTAGLPTRDVIESLEHLLYLADGPTGDNIRDRVNQVLPGVIARQRYIVEHGAMSVELCDRLLEVVTRWQFDKAEEEIAAIKKARQSVESSGLQRFETKIEGSKYVFNETLRFNQQLANGRAPSDDVFDAFRGKCLSRHPMAVLEALASFDAAFPKMLSPSVRREFARALAIRLRPERKSPQKGPELKLTAEEWPRFVQLLRKAAPESLVTLPSLWRFVLERNAELGNDAEIKQYAEEMLSVFDRRK